MTRSQRRKARKLRREAIERSETAVAGASVDVDQAEAAWIAQVDEAFRARQALVAPFVDAPEGFERCPSCGAFLIEHDSGSRLRLFCASDEFSLTAESLSEAPWWALVEVIGPDGRRVSQDR